jgi:hypothetical protein
VVKITVEADNDQVSPATPISNLFFSGILYLKIVAYCYLTFYIKYPLNLRLFLNCTVFLWYLPLFRSI